MKPLLLTLPLMFLVASANSAKSEDDCEVCVKTIDKFWLTVEEDAKSSPLKIEKAFKKFCKSSTGKENRFCYYLGGLAESATGILGEMSKPLSWAMPTQKVCEKLKKKDAQICELRFDKQIDLEKVDLKKLKVRDLKKILNNWDETCDGCLEKSDFVKRINELKPKYTKSSKSEL